jgi:hypothetical protein
LQRPRSSPAAPIVAMPNICAPADALLGSRSLRACRVAFEHGEDRVLLDIPETCPPIQASRQCTGSVLNSSAEQPQEMSCRKQTGLGAGDAAAGPNLRQSNAPNSALRERRKCSLGTRPRSRLHCGCVGHRDHAGFARDRSWRSHVRRNSNRYNLNAPRADGVNQ